MRGNQFIESPKCVRKHARKSEIPQSGGATRNGTTESPVFAESCVFLRATPNGDKDAFRNTVQQLGNGAIVEKLNSGRSFSDGRARGEGSKGYVVIRDARIKSLAAASEVQSKVSECSTAKPQ
jgi:hypothetical protein